MMKIIQIAALPMAVVAIQVDDNKNTAKKGLKKAIAAGMVAAIPAVTGQNTSTPVPMPDQCSQATFFGGLSLCDPLVTATDIAELWCKYSFGERSRTVAFNNLGANGGSPNACIFDVPFSQEPNSAEDWPAAVMTNGIINEPRTQFGYNCASTQQCSNGCKCFENSPGNILCQDSPN